MSDLAKQFEKTMTRLDPWYEKDMPDWIWDSVIEQFTDYDAFIPDGDLLIVWRSVNGNKKIPNFLDGYDAWLRTFEEYEPEDEDEQFKLFDELRRLDETLGDVINDLKGVYKMYKKHAIAPDEAPLGAIPFATRAARPYGFDDDGIHEPNTKVEDKLEDDLEDHYEQQRSITNRSKALELLKKLNRSKAYGDMFSAPIGKRVYRGICIDMKTMKKILGKNMPTKLSAKKTIKVNNVIVKPKGYSSWSTDVDVATNFILQNAGTGIVFTTTIDEKNRSAFILNPKLGDMFGYGPEKETVQIKPVRVSSITMIIDSHYLDDEDDE